MLSDKLVLNICISISKQFYLETKPVLRYYILCGYINNIGICYYNKIEYDFFWVNLFWPCILMHLYYSDIINNKYIIGG